MTVSLDVGKFLGDKPRTAMWAVGDLMGWISQITQCKFFGTANQSIERAGNAFYIVDTASSVVDLTKSTAKAIDTGSAEDIRKAAVNGVDLVGNGSLSLSFLHDVKAINLGSAQKAVGVVGCATGILSGANGLYENIPEVASLRSKTTKIDDLKADSKVWMIAKDVAKIVLCTLVLAGMVGGIAVASPLILLCSSVMVTAFTASYFIDKHIETLPRT